MCKFSERYKMSYNWKCIIWKHSFFFGYIILILLLTWFGFSFKKTRAAASSGIKSPSF